MKWFSVKPIVGALVCAVTLAAGSNIRIPSDPLSSTVIHVEDVALFYKVYDAASGHPSADQLQHDYVDAGSEGLHQFAKMRNISGTKIAETLIKHPEIYSDAKRCMVVLPQVRQRLDIAFHKLSRLYPEAKFPPVTIAIGRGKPVGIGSPVSGVQIGLEALCATNWLNPNVEDRFVHLIAHEYAHVQQVEALVDDEHPTVLEGSLIEGAAEFTAELISGEISSYQFKTMPKGGDKEIEKAFVPDEDKRDLSKWLYNGTQEKPGDLGYWVGYRIVKSYYQHADDKGRAFHQILKMNDPKSFLSKSCWYPGIQLE